MTHIQGKTGVVGIIGYPIEHSRSPIMQNAAFTAARLDYVYVPFAVDPAELETAVLGLKALGVRGYNVTIPHKTAILKYLDQLDESAEAAGAVNTVKLCENRLIGYNTDGDGLVDSLARDLGFVPGDDQILVVGAGGASRGAIAALCRSGAKHILIFNRTVEHAKGIAQSMNSRYPQTRIEVVAGGQVSEQTLGVTSLVLNTTSLGMKGERIEGVNIASLPRHAKVYDMVYSHSGTPLVLAARSFGLRAADGLGMLVSQGELAFAIWTGQSSPDGVMWQALNAASTA
jgi:shikimate dehydrogenase